MDGNDVGYVGIFLLDDCVADSAEEGLSFYLAMASPSDFFMNLGRIATEVRTTTRLFS